MNYHAIKTNAESSRMKDFELIMAHLLGGTSGLNLSREMTDEQIQEMVSTAFRVAKQIYRETHEFEVAQELERQELHKRAFGHYPDKEI